MRSLTTLTGLALMLAVPAMAAVEVAAPGDLGDGDYGYINVTATIGSYVNLDAMDNEIIFPSTATDPQASGWLGSIPVGDLGGTNTANDGEAFAQISSNRRLLLHWSAGSNLKGALYGDILPFRVQTAVTGRWAQVTNPASPVTTYYPVTDQVNPYYGTALSSGWLGIERAKADHPVAKIYTRGEIQRSGLLDAMDTYTQTTKATVTIQYANADGSQE